MMLNLLKNLSVHLVTCTLVIVFFGCFLSTTAWAQHWHGNNNTVNCTVDIKQTSFGIWVNFDLVYRATHDSASISYNCAYCTNETKCPGTNDFVCSISAQTKESGWFSGKNEIVSAFPPIVTSQLGACDQVYRQAEIRYQ